MATHCRICLEEEGTLIYPCLCKGSTGGMHRECLEKWVAESGSEICEICHEPYAKHEQCGCNIPLWASKCCTLQPRSIVERALMACTGPHVFFGGLMMFITPIDNYIFVSSIKSVALIVCLVLIQIYHSDVPFFVYKVAVVWQLVYLVLFCVIGAIRADTMTDSCNDQCYKLFHKYCNDECAVAMYYERKTKKVDQACLLEAVTFGTLLLVKTLVDCCTNMKVVKYYNRNSTLNDSTTSEEVESLLSGSSVSSSGSKGSFSSSSAGEIEV